MQAQCYSYCCNSFFFSFFLTAAILWSMMLFIIAIFLLVAICLVICMWLQYPTPYCDVQFILTQLRRQRTLSIYAKMKIPFTIADKFEEHATKSPAKTMLIFDGKKYTYDDVNRRANRIAKIAQQMGFKRGDKVRSDMLFIAFSWQGKYCSCCLNSIKSSDYYGAYFGKSPISRKKNDVDDLFSIWPTDFLSFQQAKHWNSIWFLRGFRKSKSTTFNFS